MKTSSLSVMILLASALFVQADPDDWPPRLFQVMYGLDVGNRVETLKQQIKEGADVNEPIIFDRMLREGEKPSALKGTGWPLDAAVEQSRLELVELLLSAGAIIRGAELPVASLRGKADESLAITTVLLKRGANVNSRREGFTALFWASYLGKKSTVELLLAQPEIKVNELTEDGGTALMAAVEKGHVEVVELLVKAGADVKITDKRKRTAESIAQKHPKKGEALIAALKAPPK
jgi:hypothetical protein